MKNKINEECGVFGIWSPRKTDVAVMTYYGLYALQHRGQESAGIAVNDEGLFRYYRDLGLVNDVFTPEHMEKLLARTGLGYSTLSEALIRLELLGLADSPQSGYYRRG